MTEAELDLEIARTQVPTARTVSAPLEGTESAQFAIARVKYTHDAMCDLIIAHPGILQNDIARHFGYTPAWVSRIINSDAFQARLAVRKADIVDPSLVLSVEERLRALASKSLDVVLEKLEQTSNLDTAFRGLEIATKALGYGARSGATVAVQNNFVVAMPQKAASPAEWAATHSAGGLPPGLSRLAAGEQVTDAG